MTDSLNDRHGHLNLSQCYKQPPINGLTKMCNRDVFIFNTFRS